MPIDDEARKIPMEEVEASRPDMARLATELTEVINGHIRNDTSAVDIIAALGEVSSRTFDALRIPLNVVESWTKIILSVHKAELKAEKDYLN
jgi:hypothetical protein